MVGGSDEEAAEDRNAAVKRSELIESEARALKVAGMTIDPRALKAVVESVEGWRKSSVNERCKKGIAVPSPPVLAVS